MISQITVNSTFFPEETGSSTIAILLLDPYAAEVNIVIHRLPNINVGTFGW